MSGVGRFLGYRLVLDGVFVRLLFIPRKRDIGASLEKLFPELLTGIIISLIIRYNRLDKCRVPP